MPQWALVLAVVWPVLGFISVWLWQHRGDGKLAFFRRFFGGIIIVPMFLGAFILWDIQGKMALRKAKREFSKTPVVH